MMVVVVVVVSKATPSFSLQVRGGGWELAGVL